jgi:hypothetical protein
MTKIVCPTCGVQGHLQIRGNSGRVGHYKGYKGKTRIILWHKIDPEQLITIAGKQGLVNNKLSSKSVSRNIGGRSLAWLGHRPPTPTTRVRIPAAAPCARFKLEV